MFGKIISGTFLFFFNMFIYICIDVGFEYLTGDTLVPEGYTGLYLVASAVTVYYQFKTQSEKAAKLAQAKG